MIDDEIRGLDELARLRKTAVSIRQHYPSKPVAEQCGADVLLCWSDGAKVTWVECDSVDTAAYIVGQYNAAGRLTAALHAALALVDEWDGLGQLFDRDNEDGSPVLAAKAAAYLRTSGQLRSAITAALAEGSATARAPSPSRP